MSIIGVETALGMQLVWKHPSVSALVSAMSVLVCFTAFIAAGIWQEGLTFRCSCLGAVGMDHPVLGLARNMSMFAVLGGSVLTRRRSAASSARPLDQGTDPIASS